jgi:hypothetical protein
LHHDLSGRGCVRSLLRLARSLALKATSRGLAVEGATTFSFSFAHAAPKALETSTRVTSPEFVDEMLGLIRREFFAVMSDKRYFQERLATLLAITYPARWLEDRGANATIALLRKIILNVIFAIKRHGNRPQIQRFSIYFLHCVTGAHETSRRRILCSRQGPQARRRSLATDLFASCNRPANPAQTQKKFRKPLHFRPSGQTFPQTDSVDRPDS